MVGQAEGCVRPHCPQDRSHPRGPVGEDQAPDSRRKIRSKELEMVAAREDRRPNFLVDVGRYLPRASSFELSQPAQKICFRNDRLPPLERDWLLDRFLSVLSLLFEAVYVAGWNISFPTHAEQVVWLVCTIISFSLVVAFWTVDAGVELHQRRRLVLGDQKMAVTTVKMALHAVIAIVYVAIRLYLMIEPFVCLRSLPATAFATAQ